MRAFCFAMPVSIADPTSDQPTKQQTGIDLEHVRTDTGGSVDFVRREAKRNGVQYQRMIRALLDRYAAAHESAKKA
jgi:hypothetical protein